jgi:4,5-DOPA dioxygenase extradiol
MIYDFGGFSAELYEMKYPAPGNADLAGEVSTLLNEAGISNTCNNKRGYDHGTWTPLKLMFPDADIPVVQLSIQPQLNASHHFKVGMALNSLREKNILFVGSGHITHNLRAVFGAMRGGVVDKEMARKTDEFTDWIADKLTSGEMEALLDWQKSAPYAIENHPTPEHFFPLFTAMGAGGKNPRAERLHTSRQYGMFVSDIWQFA